MPRPMLLLPGSILFALFLIGWGLSFIWGPIADTVRTDARTCRHHLSLCLIHWGGCVLCRMSGSSQSFAFWPA